MTGTRFICPGFAFFATYGAATSMSVTVGMIWRRLPTADQNIVTQPGDIILYMGSAIVIYYDQNTWNFTKLGHIDDITQDALKNILGSGNVEVKFELVK